MKVIVILLVLGLLVGMCCIAADITEEEFNSGDYVDEPESGDNPSPCGGGNGNGGSPG